jgi:hypothetical protein
MKQIYWILMVSVLLTGCASDRAYEAYGNAYAAYAGQPDVQTKACEINTKNAVTLPEGFNLVCYQANTAANLVPPQQIKDSEWTAPVHSLVGVVGTVGSIAVGGQMLKEVVGKVGKYAGHNTAGSYNPVDNSNQGNPIDNSNQGNPVTTPAPVIVNPPVVITPVYEPPVVITPVIQGAAQ